LSFLIGIESIALDVKAMATVVQSDHAVVVNLKYFLFFSCVKEDLSKGKQKTVVKWNVNKVTISYPFQIGVSRPTNKEKKTKNIFDILL